MGRAEVKPLPTVVFLDGGSEVLRDQKTCAVNRVCVELDRQNEGGVVSCKIAPPAGKPYAVVRESNGSFRVLNEPPGGKVINDEPLRLTFGKTDAIRRVNRYLLRKALLGGLVLPPDCEIVIPSERDLHTAEIFHEALTFLSSVSQNARTRWLTERVPLQEILSPIFLL